MKNFELPVSVTDLFAAFGITDPAQILILLLSSILGVLLILIVFIAFRGRPAVTNQLADQGKVDVASTADEPPEEPVISIAPQPKIDDALTTQQTVGMNAAVEAAEKVEDFQIFKRPKQKPNLVSQSSPFPAADDQMSTAEHLRLIEKEMVRLRDLYQGGHITRDMYIDETRSLYHQAHGLSSVS